MRVAATEAIEENNCNKDIAAAFDGTWQKRGHTSGNGVITVRPTSFDTGKVLEFECFSKFCIICSRNQYKYDPIKLEQHKKVCGANYNGVSGGMEVAGAKALCERSEAKLAVRYTR